MKAVNTQMKADGLFSMQKHLFMHCDMNGEVYVNEAVYYIKKTTS